MPPGLFARQLVKPLAQTIAGYHWCQRPDGVDIRYEQIKGQLVVNKDRT